MKKYLLPLLTLILLLLFSSCSNLFIGMSKSEYEKEKLLYSESDYIDHLVFLGKSYLNSSETKLFKLKKSDYRYLNSIYENVCDSNQLLLVAKRKAKFYIIKDRVPFIFSLPRANFFISTGLISRYLKHEKLLHAILSFEIVKSQLSLYPENITIPIKVIRKEKMISLLKLSLVNKVKINELTFYVMKRSGYDPFVYLMWLQLKNKNVLDFAIQRGESAGGVSKEEYLFKNFIVKEGQNDHDSMYKMNSSKEFYNFIRRIKE